MLDLRHINMDSVSKNTSTFGCFYKIKLDDKYIKLSDYNIHDGFIGHESINEVIAYRLANILGIKAVKQELVDVKVKINNKEYTTVGCISDNFFTKEFIRRYTIEKIYDKYKHENETTGKFVQRKEINKRAFDFFYILDFLIINRDRHGANIEILENNIGELLVAEPFDNGLSFVCSIKTIDKDWESQLIKFDALKDYRVNNFINSTSLYKNLELVSSPLSVNKLTKNHKIIIFDEIEKYLPKEYIDKIWEIITYRYMFLRKRGLIIEQ